MKKMTCLVLALIMALGSIPALADNVSGDWEYEKGTNGLIITKYTGDDKNVEIPMIIDKQYVRKIGDFAFAGSDIESVTFPPTIEYIGHSAFAYCLDLKVLYFNRMEVSIAGVKTNIGMQLGPNSVQYPAFVGCDLEKVYGPENSSVAVEFDSVFCTYGDELRYCDLSVFDTLTEKITIERNGTFEKDITDNFSILALTGFIDGQLCYSAEESDKPLLGDEIKITLMGKQTDSITKDKKTVLTIKNNWIRETLYDQNGNAVSDKCYLAYGDYFKYYLESFIAEDTNANLIINEIGDKAVITGALNPLGVRVIFVPAYYNSKPVEIQHGAFSLCRNLWEVGYEEGFSGDYLGNLGNAKNVTLPKGLTKIVPYAFFASDIANVVIPGSVESIGSMAFTSCDNLSRIIIGRGNLKSIGENYSITFDNSIWVQHVYIPKTVEFIHDNEFNGWWFGYKGCVVIGPSTRGEGLTFHVEKGSFAEEYAKKHNIKYEYYSEINLDGKENIEVIKALCEEMGMQINYFDKNQQILLAIGENRQIFIENENAIVINNYAKYTHSFNKDTLPTDIIKTLANADVEYCEELNSILVNYR